MNEKKLKFFSSLALILVAAIWGFAFVVVKDSLDYIGPVLMVGFRFSISALVLGLIFIPRFKKVNKSLALHGCFLGLLLFLAYVTQTIGCRYTTAGKNAFLTTIYVVLVPLLGWPIFKKRPSVFVFIAALMSVSGIGLLALNGEGSSLLKMNTGDILTLVCGLFYALHIIFGAKFVADEDPIMLTFFQFAVSGLLGFLLSPLMGEKIVLKSLLTSKVIVSLLYLGLLSSLLCFVLQNVCLKYVPSALASLFLGLESVFGVLFSTLILKESLTPRMIVGCLLIFTAILFAEVLPQLFSNLLKKKEKDHTD